MNYDEYLERETDKFLEDYDYYVSDCCGAEIEDEDDLCPECKEHCAFVSKQERDYAEYENAMCDQADAQRELDMED